MSYTPMAQRPADQRPSIALHQNGFIKVELPEGRRLHVWSPLNPPADPSGAVIHDHPFGFESFVLGGELRNTTLMALYEHQSYGEAPLNEFTVECKSLFDGLQPVPQPTFRKVRLAETTGTTYKAGESYSMTPFALHRTDAVLAVTIFHKTNHEPGVARIYAPEGQIPGDEELIRNAVDPQLLWEVVDFALMNIKMNWEDVLVWNEYLASAGMVPTMRKATKVVQRGDGQQGFIFNDDTEPHELTETIRAQVEWRRRDIAEAAIDYPADPHGSAYFASSEWTDAFAGVLPAAAAKHLADLLIMTDPMVQQATGLRAMTRNAGYIDVANNMALADFERGRFQPGSVEEIDVIGAMFPPDVLDRISFVLQPDWTDSRRPTAAVTIVLSYGKGYLFGDHEIANEREILVVKRKDSDLVGTPGGKIEPGESALQAAVRELYEETGLKAEERLVRFVGTFWDGERWTACFLWDRRQMLVNAILWEGKTKDLPDGVSWKVWDVLLDARCTPWPEFYAKVRPIVDKMAPPLPQAVIHKSYRAAAEAKKFAAKLAEEAKASQRVNYHLTENDHGAFTVGPTTMEPGFYQASEELGRPCPCYVAPLFAAINAHRDGEKLPSELPSDVITWAEISSIMMVTGGTADEARAKVLKRRKAHGVLVDRAEVEARLGNIKESLEPDAKPVHTPEEARELAEAFMPLVREPDPIEQAEHVDRLTDFYDKGLDQDRGVPDGIFDDGGSPK